MDTNKEINDQQGGSSWAVARKVKSMGGPPGMRLPHQLGTPCTSKASLKIPDLLRVPTQDQGRHGPWFDAFSIDFTQLESQNVPVISNMEMLSRIDENAVKCVLLFK